jgi:hypothetical protein
LLGLFPRIHEGDSLSSRVVIVRAFATGSTSEKRLTSRANERALFAETFTDGPLHVRKSRASERASRKRKIVALAFN